MSEYSSRKKCFGGNQIMPIIFAAVAALFVWMGLKKYGFWHPAKGPLPGFYPTIIGAGLFVMSVLGFIFSFKDKKPIFPRENWWAVIGGLSIIVGTFIIGLIPSVGIYVIVWLRWFEGCSWKVTLITFAVIMAIVIGCFVLWLQVPFPRGVLLELILK